MTTTSDAGVVAKTTTSDAGAFALPDWLVAHGEAYRGERVVRGRRFAYALWDSRHVALTLVPGQIDPGGSGMVAAPVWERLIAAFNGGFRGIHGEYGFRAEGRTFRPPRAGLATLARRAEGPWTLGALPDGHTLEGADAFRQNLWPLFADGTFDPAKRGRFGALAPGKHAGRTTRSALGLRADGCFVYAYGIDVTAEELGLAVAEADVRFAMALDINDGQVGFEWLTVGAPTGNRAPPAATDAGRATWHGAARGRAVHAERLTVPMGTPLPRWLRGDSRDYFVLSRATEPLPPARIATAPRDWAAFAQKEK